MLAGTVTIEHVRAIGRQLRNLPGYGSVPASPDTPGTRAHCATILAKVVPFAATRPVKRGRRPGCW
ncbi:MAG: hypothetical protein U0R65_02590 [Candidatus Nanopelagicales bacterium]